MLCLKYFIHNNCSWLIHHTVHIVLVRSSSILIGTQNVQFFELPNFHWFTMFAFILFILIWAFLCLVQIFSDSSPPPPPGIGGWVMHGRLGNVWQECFRQLSRVSSHEKRLKHKITFFSAVRLGLWTLAFHFHWNEILGMFFKLVDCFLLWQRLFVRLSRIIWSRIIWGFRVLLFGVMIVLWN